jgi:hypothetical protein
MAVLCAPPLLRAEEEPKVKLSLSRIAGPITVDGDLSDAAWKDATVVDTFIETGPGDNVPPPVKTLARIGYDDRFFYVSFWCQDPDMSKLRAPFVDRDGINDDQDYVGILLDVENSDRSAIDFWIGPRGIQADSVFFEGSFNEDFGPDYFWESAGRIGADGWSVEVAIPLSSLRYPEKDPQDWALALYRIYPREFNYQIYSVRLPRGSSCFLCHSARVEGITGLPRGAHYVVAPYAAGSSTKTYPGFDGYSGDGQVTKGKVGVDAKWLPDADTIVDATLNPDFSQVESDVAQIAVNERFALFYPEKRPFFLEHVDLLRMPIQAVYTRTITSPFWGGRVTGKAGGTNFTALVANDRGGGTVIIPGPVFSDSAPQDFESVVAVARVRQDLGRSFAGLVGTARSIDGSDGGGYNYVGGGDFQWRPNDDDVVTGQYLYSVTRDPERPDLFSGWTGERHSGFGGTVKWEHTTRHWDWTAGYDDFAAGFRADDGFVPQVGYREVGGNVGYRFFPTGFFSRIHPLAGGNSQNDREGGLIQRRVFPGVSFQAQWGLRGEFDYNFEAVQIDGRRLDFDRFVWTLSASPSRLVPRVSIQGNYGEQPDVFNVRVGHGASILANAVIRPTDHLALDLLLDRQWIDETVSGLSGRLFTATVARAKAIYVFNSRMLIRLIGQYVETTRDQALWTTPIVEKEGVFSGSALFSYKLNWQTVLFLGYGDNRALVDENGLGTDFVLKPADRQVFLKVSYAFSGSFTAS